MKFKFSVASQIATLFVLATLSLPCALASGRVKSYAFKGTPDGAYPVSSLIQDADGNLYGTTRGGGQSSACRIQYGCGTVFELSRNQGGGWTKMTLYNFTGGADGYNPQGLAFDPLGNLYGVDEGYPGVVFELTPGGAGTWTEKTIFNFQVGATGWGPSYNPVFDAAGNLYGVTTSGGICNQQVYCGGVIYELVPGQTGIWTEKVLYQFPLDVNGFGPGPNAIIMDLSGNIFGTTAGGGTYDLGTVYELMPNQDGSWSEKDLYDFADGFDGGFIDAPVSFDAAGNLFGEAYEGGSLACPRSGCGTLFELTPQLDGTWLESTIHTFSGLNGVRGEAPTGGLAFDGRNFYGITQEGGVGACQGSNYSCGTMFEFSSASPSTSFHMLGSFNGIDGFYPSNAPTLDARGNIYGISLQGGDPNCNPGAGTGCGTIFEITP